MPVEISTLSRRDVDQYIELLRSGFGEELGQRGTNIARTAHMVKALVSCGGIPLRLIKAVTGHSLFILAAKDGSRVVGALGVLEARIPSLIGIYVTSEYRGQGIAIELVQEALRRLKKQGYKEAHVSVIDHTAQLLAQRGGFVPYDHTDLYEHSLPANISIPDGAFVKGVRRLSLPRHAYDLGPLNHITGVHVRRLVAHLGKQQTLAAMLIALPHQIVGEIQPVIIIPGREDVFPALLDAGYKWFSHLGRTLVSVSLHDDTASLADILTSEGFVRRRSWVELRIDL